MLILFAPILQDTFTFYYFKPLAGDIANPNCDSIKVANWLSGEYQEKKQVYLNASFGFRNWLVRLNNQIRFELFKKPEPQAVIVGKENYLYEKNYIDTYCGLDFLGEDSIHHTVDRLKFISDTLDKLGKKLIVVLSPGKASFFPEFIPDKMLVKTNNTNYNYFAKELTKSNIYHIDFNKYFIENKTKSKYPLYPKYGIHWSFYGATLAADSMLKKMSALSKTNLSRVKLKEVLMAQPNKLDYDIGEAMNLFTRFESPDLAYPKIEYISDSNTVRPRVLFVSDSFFWTMGETGFTNCFSEYHFWYYNRQVYPETFTNETLTDQIDLSSQIEKNDFIVVMSSEPNLKNIGWNFIEQLYQSFKVKKARLAQQSKEIQDMINYIKTDKSWLQSIREKAKSGGISLDSAILKDAIWTLNNKK
jgi:hypothetical protein